MKKRISFDLAEEHQVKLESLTGKRFVNSADYQKAIISLIDKAYEKKR